MNHPEHVTIADSTLPDPIKEILIQHGFQHLAEVFAIPVTDCMTMEWFTPEIFQELFKYRSAEKKPAS